MKIAILITGQLRDYKINCLNHIKHLIEPNNADVFIYACTTNTLHSTGVNITQKYNITTQHNKEELIDELKAVYGRYIKGIEINENEDLTDNDFGTLGYFKRKINNQMSNIRSGFLMSEKFSQQNDFQYDIIIRCRPDNSKFPNKLELNNSINSNTIYSTIYPSGHKDPWFFSFADRESFEKYCSFIYMKDCDESRTDNNFDYPELALEKYINSTGMNLVFLRSACLPFYGYDKTKPIQDFPYRDKNAKLINADGDLVNQVI